MESLPFVQQYARLKAQGLTPLRAGLELCRANPARLSWVVRWLSTKVPEQSLLWNRFLRYVEAENKGRRSRVGVSDDGCYRYHSLFDRPQQTVFIEWRTISNIYVQDGLDFLALALYAPGKDGGKFMQAQSDMEGFASFVEAVSQRYFGSDSFLMGKFKPGPHPARKFQVWPTETDV